MATHDEETYGVEPQAQPPQPPPIVPPQQTHVGVGASTVRCVSCGYDLSGTAIGGTCSECGEAVATSLRAPTARTSGLAIGSFVCGIISLSMAICLPFGILGIVAIVLYFPAMKQVNEGAVGGSSKGFAVAGLIMGIISTFLAFSCLGIGILSEFNNW